MWDQIVGWALLACLGLAILWGRRAAKAKAQRIRNEAYAEGGRAAVAVYMSQNVEAGNDQRRVSWSVDDDATGDDDASIDGATLDYPRIDGPGLWPGVRGGDGRDQLGSGRVGPALGHPAGTRRPVGDGGRRRLSLGRGDDVA